MSSAKRWFINLSLALAGIALALLVTEGSMRILRPGFLVGTDHMPCIYQEDDQLGYRYRPGAIGRIHRNFEVDNIVRINSLGFHDIEHELSDDNRLRIIAIGDSFTAALHVDPSEGWTQTLQRQLVAMGYSSSEVLNLGLDGTGTDIHLAILKQYLPVLQPRIVILAFHETDIDDISRGRLSRECYNSHVLMFQNQDQRNQLRDLVDSQVSNDPSKWLFDNFYSYRAVVLALMGRNNSLRTNFLTPSHLGVTVDRTAYPGMGIHDVFQEFLNLSRQYGFDLLVIPIPGKDGRSGTEILRKALSQRQFADLHVIDVAPIMEELLELEDTSYSELFWQFDGHFSTYGNRIFGIAVADSFSRYLEASYSDQ